MFHNPSLSLEDIIEQFISSFSLVDGLEGTSSSSPSLFFSSDVGIGVPPPPPIMHMLQMLCILLSCCF
jgi:hypothetical protein